MTDRNRAGDTDEVKPLRVVPQWGVFWPAVAFTIINVFAAGGAMQMLWQTVNALKELTVEVRGLRAAQASNDSKNSAQDMMLQGQQQQLNDLREEVRDLRRMQ
ncbi:MAG TPA: hypothetical protein VJU83_09775 [Burkholderiales bacterium]|nr:hypothetical protein [Burkholderiales bacterium]